MCRQTLFLQTWFTRGQSGHFACFSSSLYLINYLPVPLLLSFSLLFPLYKMCSTANVVSANLYNQTIAILDLQ